MNFPLMTVLFHETQCVRHESLKLELEMDWKLHIHNPQRSASRTHTILFLFKLPK